MGFSDFWSQSNRGSKQFNLEQLKGQDSFSLDDLSKKLNLDKEMLKSVFLKADSDKSGSIQLSNSTQENELNTFLGDLNATFDSIKKTKINDPRYNELYEYKDAYGNNIAEYYKDGEIVQKTIINKKAYGNKEEITYIAYANGRPSQKSEYKNGNIMTTTYAYKQNESGKTHVQISSFDSNMNQLYYTTEKVDSDGNPITQVLEATVVNQDKGTVSELKIKDGKLYENVYDGSTRKIQYINVYDNTTIDKYNQGTELPSSQVVPTSEKPEDNLSVEYDRAGNTYIFARMDDTWEKLAKQFNMAVAELKNLNKEIKAIAPCTKLKVKGQYSADSETLKGRITKDALTEQNKVRKALSQLYTSKIATKTLKNNYKSVYDYAASILKMRGITPNSADFKKKRNLLANELLVLNGANAKYTKGSKIKVIEGTLDANLVEEFKNAGIKPTEKNQVFFGRLYGLNKKQQQNILDVVKDCQKRGITDTKKINSEILKYYPHLNMFDTDIQTLSKPTELDERKYAAEMLIGQIMSIIEGYQGQLNELERNPFNIIAMGGQNAHQMLKDAGVEDLYQKAFKKVFPGLSVIISKGGDLLTKIDLVKAWCDNLTKGESKINLEKGLAEKLKKAVALLDEIKKEYANKDADFETRKRLAGAEKQKFNSMYSAYAGKQLDNKQLEAYLSASRKYEQTTEYHNAQIEKEMQEIAAQIDRKFGERINRLSAGNGRDTKLEGEIKELLNKYFALYKKMDSMPDNKKAQARRKMEAEYKKLNIEGDAFKGLDKRIQDFVEGTSTRGMLTEMAAVIAFMVLSGGGAAFGAYGSSAGAYLEGGMSITMRQAGKSMLMRKLLTENVQVAARVLAGVPARVGIPALGSALLFNVPKAAMVGTDVVTGDSEHLVQDAEMLKEGVVGLTEFGVVGALATGPAGQFLGQGLKAGMTSNALKKALAMTGAAGKTTKSMRNFLNNLSKVSESVGKTAGFSATFGLNAGYMAFSDGMEYTQAVISLSQMDGVSKLVVAMLCRNAAGGMIPQLKGRKISAEQMKKIVEDVNKKLEEKGINFDETKSPEEIMTELMNEVAKTTDEVVGVNEEVKEGDLPSARQEKVTGRADKMERVAENQSKSTKNENVPFETVKDDIPFKPVNEGEILKSRLNDGMNTTSNPISENFSAIKELLSSEHKDFVEKIMGIRHSRKENPIKDAVKIKEFINLTKDSKLPIFRDAEFVDFVLESTTTTNGMSKIIEETCEQAKKVNGSELKNNITNYILYKRTGIDKHIASIQDKALKNLCLKELENVISLPLEEKTSTFLSIKNFIESYQHLINGEALNYRTKYGKDFVDYIKKSNPDVFDKFMENEGLKDENLSKKQIEALKDYQENSRWEEFIETCKKYPSSKVGKYLYKNVYLASKTMPENVRKLSLLIDEEFNTKVFLPHNMKEAGVALKLIYAELSAWKMVSEGKAKMPPCLDFITSKFKYFKEDPATGFSECYQTGAVSIDGLTIDRIWYTLRHEIMHTNDMKKVPTFLPEHNIETRREELTQELLNAGIPKWHVDYAFENPLEFIAVASEGNMKLYSPKFKKLLLELGMPEWCLKMNNNNPEIRKTLELKEYEEFSKTEPGKKVVEVFADDIEILSVNDFVKRMGYEKLGKKSIDEMYQFYEQRLLHNFLKTRPEQKVEDTFANETEIISREDFVKRMGYEKLGESSVNYIYRHYKMMQKDKLFDKEKAKLEEKYKDDKDFFTFEEFLKIDEQAKHFDEKTQRIFYETYKKAYSKFEFMSELLRTKINKYQGELKDFTFESINDGVNDRTGQVTPDNNTSGMAMSTILPLPSTRLINHAKQTIQRWFGGEKEPAGVNVVNDGVNDADHSLGIDSRAKDAGDQTNIQANFVNKVKSDANAELSSIKFVETKLKLKGSMTLDDGTDLFYDKQSKMFKAFYRNDVCRANTLEKLFEGIQIAKMSADIENKMTNENPTVNLGENTVIRKLGAENYELVSKGNGSEDIIIHGITLTTVLNKLYNGVNENIDIKTNLNYSKPYKSAVKYPSYNLITGRLGNGALYNLVRESKDFRQEVTDALKITEQKILEQDPNFREGNYSDYVDPTEDRFTSILPDGTIISVNSPIKDIATYLFIIKPDGTQINIYTKNPKEMKLANRIINYARLNSPVNDKTVFKISQKVADGMSVNDAISQLTSNKNGVNEVNSAAVGQVSHDKGVTGGRLGETQQNTYISTGNKVFDVKPEDFAKNHAKIKEVQASIDELRKTEPHRADELQIVLDMFKNPTKDYEVSDAQLNAVARFIHKQYAAAKDELNSTVKFNELDSDGTFSSRIKSEASLKVKLENYLKDAINDRQEDPEKPIKTLYDAYIDVRDAYACRTEFKSAARGTYTDTAKIQALKNEISQLEQQNADKKTIALKKQELERRENIIKLVNEAKQLRAEGKTELAESKMLDASRIAAEIQSQPYVEKIKAMLDRIKEEYGDVDVLRLTNYTSKEGISILSREQLCEIKQYGADKGVKVDFIKLASDIHPDATSEFVKGSSTKQQPTGYMAIQVNFRTKSGMVFEHQFRGQLTGKLAESEHPLYDLRTGKCPWKLHPELEGLYKPIGELIEENVMPEEAYKNHQKYLMDYNTHLRKLELGFDSEAPRMEDYELYIDEKGVEQRFKFDSRLTAENLMKLDDVAKAVQNETRFRELKQKEVNGQGLSKEETVELSKLTNKPRVAPENAVAEYHKTVGVRDNEMTLLSAKESINKILSSYTYSVKADRLVLEHLLTEKTLPMVERFVNKETTQPNLLRFLDVVRRRKYNISDLEKILGEKQVIDEKLLHTLEFKNFEKAKNVTLENFNELSLQEKKDFINGIISINFRGGEKKHVDVLPDMAIFRNLKSRKAPQKTGNSKEAQNLFFKQNADYIAKNEKEYTTILNSLLEQIPRGKQAIPTSTNGLNPNSVLTVKPPITSNVSSIPTSTAKVGSHNVRVGVISEEGNYFTHSLEEHKLSRLEGYLLTDPDAILSTGLLGRKGRMKSGETRPSIIVSPKNSMEDLLIASNNDASAGYGARRNFFNVQNMFLTETNEHNNYLPNLLKQKLHLTTEEYNLRIAKIKNITHIEDLEAVDKELYTAIKSVMNENPIYESIMRPNVEAIYLPKGMKISEEIASFAERYDIPVLFKDAADMPATRKPYVKQTVEQKSIMPKEDLLSTTVEDASEHANTHEKMSKEKNTFIEEDNFEFLEEDYSDPIIAEQEIKQSIISDLCAKYNFSEKLISHLNSLELTELDQFIKSLTYKFSQYQNAINNKDFDFESIMGRTIYNIEAFNRSKVSDLAKTTALQVILTNFKYKNLIGLFNGAKYQEIKEYKIKNNTDCAVFTEGEPDIYTEMLEKAGFDKTILLDLDKASLKCVYYIVEALDNAEFLHSKNLKADYLNIEPELNKLSDNVRIVAIEYLRKVRSVGNAPSIE